MTSEHTKVETCSITGMPVCRRMLNMNLALGYTEEFYSLSALAEKHDMSMEEMFDFALDYIQARECFRKEWVKMQDASECPLPNDCLIDRCFSRIRIVNTQNDYK